MTQKNEALRLADAQDCVTDDNCGYCIPCSVAAELRRLHAENEAFGIHLSERMKDLAKVEAQRDALLEALRKHVYLHDKDCVCEDCAAIKAVEANT